MILFALALVSATAAIQCNVGEITWNDVLVRDEGLTIRTDCAVFWPRSNQDTCKTFKWKVANYEKTYYTCGNCSAEGEPAPYNVSALTKTCKECTEEFCNVYSSALILSPTILLLLLSLLH